MLKVYELPLRWDVLDELPKSRSRIRPLIKQLHEGRLRVSSEALQLLSLLSGRYLRSAQRRILLDVLREHLTDTRHLGSLYGPLAMADVLGAVVGLAVFLLDGRSDWSFVRIPEGTTPTADIFARAPGGAPWNLELKATAPLSSEVERGEALDACQNVLKQRYVGMKQLAGANMVLKPSRRAPALQVLSRFPKQHANAFLGGRALAISVLTDAALTARADIPANTYRDCPAGKLCATTCFSTTAPSFAVSAGTLLWAQPRARRTSSPEPNTGFEQLLLAAQDVDSARWAGSSEGVEAATVALSREVDRLAAVLPEELVTYVVTRVVSAVGGLVSAETFYDLLHHLPQQVIPTAARLGRARSTSGRRVVRSIEGLEETTDDNAEVMDESLQLGGTRSGRVVELAPVVARDRAAREPEAREDAASRTLQVLERVRPRRGAITVPVEIGLDDASAIIGFARLDGHSGRTLALATLDGRVDVRLDA